MTQSIVDDTISILVDHFAIDARHTTASTKLDHLGFDSLVLVELTLILQRRFGVTVSQDEIGKCQTVGDIAEAVRSRAAS
jgi:acyl carrier protein